MGTNVVADVVEVQWESESSCRRERDLVSDIETTNPSVRDPQVELTSSTEESGDTLPFVSRTDFFFP